ncbi:hypothetical protein GCM10022222_55220 [Amycolatopsis ultiminotia]|uniref:OmpR/PhoB-type domain-containing protein n=2 Tax=Amycolatopsis ultiminotia TaxID=543629 RepID=A0ABP6XCD9_9PSEU
MERDGVPIPLPGGKQLALLAVLALSPRRLVPIEEIADRLWDEAPPAAAATTIRGYVRRLRRALGADSVIESGHHGYRLGIAAGAVDLHRFDELTAAAETEGEPAAEAGLLREALALWRGPALSDVPGDLLHREVVPALRERYLRALHRRIDLDLEHGDPAALVAELRMLVDENPLRERCWAQWIRALHGAGRRAEALAGFEECRVVLADRLGVDPCAALRELHQHLLEDDHQPFTPAVAVPPRQLPPEVSCFTGRQAHLAALDAALAAGEAPGVVVDGAAGVGKTALVVRWAHRVRESFPGGVLYVDLRGYSPHEPLDPVEALEVLLSPVCHGRLPREPEARTALLRSTLAGRRVLVVLDNARDAEQVRPLLPGAGNHVVITSRNQLRGLVARDGARRIRLGRLSGAESAELLRRLLGERAAGAPGVVAELADRCARLPLALRVLAERADRYPQLPLAAFAAELRDERTALAALGGESAIDLPTVLSWSYPAVPPEAARLFRLLGRQPERTVDARAAAALMRISGAEAGRLLDSLAEVNLLGQPIPHRFEIDRLLRGNTVTT